MSDDLDKMSELGAASLDAQAAPTQQMHHGVPPETLAAASRVMNRFVMGMQRPSSPEDDLR